MQSSGRVCASRTPSVARRLLVIGWLLALLAAPWAAIADTPDNDSSECHETLPALAAPLAELIEWLAAETDYDCTRLHSSLPVFQLCCTGDVLSIDDHTLVVPESLRGVYDESRHTVYLVRPWSIADLFSRSVLLHELVHVLQTDQARLGCDNQGEWEAYKLQERWLLQHGIDPGFDWFYIAMLSSCTVRDFHPALDVGIDDPPPHCRQRTADAANTLTLEDFQWQLSLREMEALADQLYDSGKRLPSPAWFDASRRRWQADLSVDGRDVSISLTNPFIRSVTRTIETVLAQGLASRVLFSDLGHAHLYVPTSHWQRNYAGYDGPWYRRLEAMLADPALRPLYHASEQLALRTERSDVDGHAHADNDATELARRRACRNLLASHDGSERLDVLQAADDPWNTVIEIPGYVRHGAGFLVSASARGCFEFTDATGALRRFDIGLSDLGSPDGKADICMP